MSLLHQDTPEEIGGPTLGEEYTKGSSHVVWASIAAAVLVTIAIAIYVLAGEKKPPSTGDVLQVWARPLHSVTSGVDANGAKMATETFDHVLVFARVTLHNQSDKPLFLHQIMTNATLGDGPHTSYAATLTDYERVFLAYPELAALHSKGLTVDAPISPAWCSRPTRRLLNSRRPRGILGRRKIPGDLVLSAYGVDHDLKQGGLLAAVELQRFVQVPVLLLVLLVVRVHIQRIAVFLGVGFLQFQAYGANGFLLALAQGEFVIIAVAL